MVVSELNLAMTRGDSEYFNIAMIDENKNPVPFQTGDTVYFTVKESVNETDIILQKVITEFSDGKALIEILPEDTNKIPFGTYVYDVQVNFREGFLPRVKTIIKVKYFTIGGEVTYD